MKLIAPACLTAVAALALAGQASATTTGSCTPTNDAQITFDTVNRFDTPRAFEVRANGVVVISDTILLRRPGATIAVDLPTPTGPVLLEVFASENFQTAMTRVFAGECGVPTPPPVPNPPEDTPDDTPPVVVPPDDNPPAKVTCASLIKANAGKMWLVKYRCATRLPVSCKVLKKVGAGRLTYARAGYYYRCAKPPVPKPGIPAVAGERA